MKQLNDIGQSTIEFILTFMFGLGIIFLFVNISVNYSVGYLVHYATFMASRTYLTFEIGVGDPAASDPQAGAAALETFRRFKMDAVGVPSGSVLGGGGAEPGFHINRYSSVTTNEQALFVGAYTVFERPLSFFRAIAGDTKGTLISESYLGKEPVRAECWQRTCKAISIGVKGNPTACGGADDYTVFDNGC